MRIGAGAQPPPSPNLPSRSATAPTVLERAALLRLEALVAGTQDLFAAKPAVDQPAGELPMPLAARLAIPPAPPLANGGLSTASPSVEGPERPSIESPLLGSAVLRPGLSLTSSGSGRPSPSDVQALASALATDRLSLSPAATVLRVAPGTPSNRAAAEFAQDLLSALTGEPRGRLLLTAFGQPMPADPEALASLVSRGPNELLQLLLRGIVHTTDARQISMTLGMAVQRQAGAATLDAAVLDAIQAVLDKLAKSELDLDYPGDSSALAGRSASFQAVVDPRGLWPMQSFVLSGLLVLGHALDEAEIEEIERDDSEELEPEDQSRDDPAGEAPIRLPRRKRKHQSLAEATPPATDGGPPIISASRWLELELHHWRAQLRLWMTLPPSAMLADR